MGRSIDEEANFLCRDRQGFNLTRKKSTISPLRLIPPIKNLKYVGSRGKAQDREPAQKSPVPRMCRESLSVFFRFIFPSRGEAPCDMLSVLFASFYCLLSSKKDPANAANF
jgi:hypothetical protein